MEEVKSQRRILEHRLWLDYYNKWVCSGKIKNGADSCPSLPIYEEEIKPLLLDVFQNTKHRMLHLIRPVLFFPFAASGDALRMRTPIRR